ncbi:hypothetical protein CULT_500041 [[Clostridium] ultunense Esp]|nr:hypothetical protein CULT_500041 [[Clostridium] ultunense Esp]
MAGFGMWRPEWRDCQPLSGTGEGGCGPSGVSLALPAQETSGSSEETLPGYLQVKEGDRLGAPPCPT